MNVLAVGANPDDIELLCAGTLAACAQRGDAVSICYLTTGDKGSTDIPPREMAAIRRKEAKKSASIIGADVFPLGIPDGEVEVTLQLRRRIVEIIRKTAPDVIITHYPHDYMSDHNCTSRLVFDASFWAGVQNFDGRPGDSPACQTRLQMFYMDTVCGIGFAPQEYVDISEVIDVKMEMIAQHESQVKYMKEHDGFDMLEYVKTSARYRGYQCGITYAEGYVPVRVFPLLSSKRLLP